MYYLILKLWILFKEECVCKFIEIYKIFVNLFKVDFRFKELGGN